MYKMFLDTGTESDLTKWNVREDCDMREMFMDADIYGVDGSWYATHLKFGGEMLDEEEELKFGWKRIDGEDGIQWELI
jgi:hypothetical protein